MMVIMGNMIEEDEISENLIKNDMHDLHEQTNYILKLAEGKNFLKLLISMVITVFVILAILLGTSLKDAEDYRISKRLFEKKSEENGYRQVEKCDKGHGLTLYVKPYHNAPNRDICQLEAHTINCERCQFDASKLEFKWKPHFNKFMYCY